MILRKKNTNKARVVKKYDNGGKSKENPTPSDQIKKAEEARNFLRMLYADQHTRDIINRNLRFVDMGSFDENDKYIPSDTRPFLDNPPDISQDTPEFLIPRLNEIIKADIGGNPIKFLERPDQIGRSTAMISDQLPGVASYGGKDLYENLSMMYPHRSDELATRAGIANLYADLMGDYSATMGNFITGKNEWGTTGYVQSNPNPGMSEYTSEYGGPTRVDYKPRVRGLGTKRKPMTMGMGMYQNRMNEAIQVNTDADMGTYVHELTHAGDLSTNSFNERYIDQNRHYYTRDPDNNEMDRKQVKRASRYGRSPGEFAEYIATPTETLARLNVLRYAMYKHFGSEDSPYKQEDFVNYTYGQVPTRDMKIFKEQGKDIVKALEDLQAVYPDEAIFEMLNNVYKRGGRVRGGVRVVKKAKTGMRVKKSNGDPPKGYKKDPDGYLTPIDFSEFHEETPQDSLFYIDSPGERISRQLFMESGGEKDPNRAVSPAGAQGAWQIMPATQKDMEDRGLIPKGLDPFNPEHSRQMRDAKINALMKLPFIAKPPQEIPEINRLARIYASYNFGEGNTMKALEKAKSEGVNIYGDPHLWMPYLPLETRNYLRYILFNEDKIR